MGSTDNSRIPLEPIVDRRLREVIDSVRPFLDDDGLDVELDRGRTHAERVILRVLTDAVDDHAALANAVTLDLENVGAASWRPVRA
ncbi:MAG: hypothetical protein ACRD0A_06450 [Acidimicrobiales bacterium]